MTEMCHKSAILPYMFFPACVLQTGLIADWYSLRNRAQCLETDRAGLIKWAETEKQQIIDSFETEKEAAIKAKTEVRKGKLLLHASRSVTRARHCCTPVSVELSSSVN